MWGASMEEGLEVRAWHHTHRCTGGSTARGTFAAHATAQAPMHKQPGEGRPTLSTLRRSSLPSLPDSWCVDDTLMCFLNMLPSFNHDYGPRHGATLHDERRISKPHLLIEWKHIQGLTENATSRRSQVKARRQPGHWRQQWRQQWRQPVCWAAQEPPAHLHIILAFVPFSGSPSRERPP